MVREKMSLDSKLQTEYLSFQTFQKNFIDGDRIMNKVLINSNIHDGAASIAKPSTPKFTETTEFKEALAYVETMVSKGGKPVPADADGWDALVEMKYAL
jgi:hypothetical protein